MSDFIFSVNVTFPIFLVMVIGWVCLLYTSDAADD